MSPLMLFTDGSVHPPTRIGYGAYLALPALGADARVQLKRFENVGCSQLEIKTLIWALEELRPTAVTVYTDSQTIMGLPGRRARFDARNYLNAQGISIKNADLYRAFFRLIDQIDCTFVKVNGHRVSNKKTDIDQLFTQVDRASRLAMRADRR